MKSLLLYRFAIAAAAMLIVLVTAGQAVARGGSLTDIAVPVALLMLLFGLGVWRIRRRAKARREQAEYEQLVREHEAKKAARGPVAIVGKECADCVRKIVIEADGVSCPFCRHPVHNDCLGSHRTKSHAEAGYR
jgi:hypothetical protein